MQCYHIQNHYQDQFSPILVLICSPGPNENKRSLLFYVCSWSWSWSWDFGLECITFTVCYNIDIELTCTFCNCLLCRNSYDVLLCTEDSPHFPIIKDGWQAADSLHRLETVRMGESLIGLRRLRSLARNRTMKRENRKE